MLTANNVESPLGPLDVLEIAEKTEESQKCNADDKNAEKSKKRKCVEAKGSDSAPKRIRRNADIPQLESTQRTSHGNDTTDVSQPKATQNPPHVDNVVTVPQLTATQTPAHVNNTVGKSVGQIPTAMQRVLEAKPTAPEKRPNKRRNWATDAGKKYLDRVVTSWITKADFVEDKNESMRSFAKRF